MKLQKLKKEIKSFWKFIWEGKSLASYIAFFLFSIIVLSIAYPLTLKLLSITVGINDLVAVVTPSMEHNNKDIYYGLSDSKVNESSLPFKNGLYRGDLVVVMKAKNISIGEVIIFRYRGSQYIHRVVNKLKENGKYYFRTKGDANCCSLEFEKNISKKQIEGKAVYKIPYLGIPKMLLTQAFMRLA